MTLLFHLLFAIIHLKRRNTIEIQCQYRVITSAIIPSLKKPSPLFSNEARLSSTDFVFGIPTYLPSSDSNVHWITEPKEIAFENNKIPKHQVKIITGLKLANFKARIRRHKLYTKIQRFQKKNPTYLLNYSRKLPKAILWILQGRSRVRLKRKQYLLILRDGSQDFLPRHLRDSRNYRRWMQHEL